MIPTYFIETEGGIEVTKEWGMGILVQWAPPFCSG